MFKKELPIITMGLSIVAAILVLSWAVFIKSGSVIPIQSPVVSDEEIVSDGIEDNRMEDDDVLADDISNEFFTFTKDDQIFSVSKSEFKVLNKFNALELKSESEDCGTNKSEQYFKELLSYYSENSNGIEYQFKYIGQTQDFGAWVVMVVPNKIGYINFEEFKNDFNLCEAGSDRYPALMSDKYFLFVSSCGTGFDDGSGLPNGCDVVRKIIEPTIRIK